jgi:preprotein translocase subunit YajC
MSKLWILAESDIVSQDITEGESMETGTIQDGQAQPTGDKTPPPPGFQKGQLIFIVAMIAIMYLFIFRGPKKKQKQHAQMVESLQRNDKVQTIGGILGTIIDVKDDEITLKIDESNNTKMKVTPGAISRKVSKEND